jgi:tartrate dehydratase beta subunit/fumarate hydratase class I family protein
LQSTWGGTGLSPAFFAACANSQQVVVIALSGCAQLITPSIVIGICDKDESPETTGVEVVTGAAGVFTGGGGASPRHVVVIALSGCAQLITPSIVSGMLLATTGVTPVRMNEALTAIELRIFKILFID